jgi:hypothetical protein
MRGCDREAICKAFRTDHGLGIWATHNLSEKGKKGRCGGKRKSYKGKQRRVTKRSGLRRTDKENSLVAGCG